MSDADTPAPVSAPLRLVTASTALQPAQRVRVTYWEHGRRSVVLQPVRGAAALDTEDRHGDALRRTFPGLVSATRTPDRAGSAARRWALTVDPGADTGPDGTADAARPYTAPRGHAPATAYRERVPAGCTVAVTMMGDGASRRAALTYTATPGRERRSATAGIPDTVTAPLAVFAMLFPGVAVARVHDDGGRRFRVITRAPVPDRYAPDPDPRRR